MPTATPKPAPPPVAKPAPVAAPTPAHQVPDGWTVFHRLSVIQIPGQDPTQTIEAVAEHDLGMSVTTGPLIASAFAEDIRKAAALLTELLAPQLVPVTTPPPPPAATPAADPPLAPIQVQQPADPANTPATAEAIAAVVAAVEQLTPEWQTYVLETFRIEFGLPQNRKLATTIKSVRHCEFIQSMLPS